MLLVVFVPMFLDSEPRPARTGPTLAIPPKDNPPPLPAPSAAPISTVEAGSGTVAPASDIGPRTIAATAASGATKHEAASGATKHEAASGQQASVAPAQAGAQSPVAQAKAGVQSPALEGFAVQVGAFRDESKLAQVRDKLAAAGVVHYTERIESKGGPMTRLRAGPFPTREAAEAGLAKLKRASLDGKVVPLAAEREERKP